MDDRHGALRRRRHRHLHCRIDPAWRADDTAGISWRGHRRSNLLGNGRTRGLRLTGRSLTGLRLGRGNRRDADQQTCKRTQSHRSIRFSHGQFSMPAEINLPTAIQQSRKSWGQATFLFIRFEMELLHIRDVGLLQSTQGHIGSPTMMCAKRSIVMFHDEPTELYDALRWHRGLVGFYQMNLLRPLICSNPSLCEAHRMELHCHQDRLADLEATLSIRTYPGDQAHAARQHRMAARHDA